jgi:hypothetical protein
MYELSNYIVNKIKVLLARVYVTLAEFGYHGTLK